MTELVSLLTEEGVGEMIASRVAEGEALGEIARTEGMPYSVLWRWLMAEEGRMQAYEAALEAKADAEAHRILEIADGATAEDATLAKLQVDARKWLAGKWSKRRYGEDKEAMGVGGITVVVNRGNGTPVLVGEKTLVIEG